MKYIIKLLEYILTFILFIIILCICTIRIADTTILSKDYILSMLEDTNYYANTYNEIINDFSKHLSTSLDSSIQDNIISIDLVKEHTNYIINNIYDGENNIIDTETIHDKLYSNMMNNIGNRELESVEKKQVEKYINTITEEYMNDILHTEYESSIYNKLVKINKYINIMYKVLLISLLVDIILLVFIKFNFLRKISLIGISMLSSGIVLIFIEVFIKLSIDIDNIRILSSSFIITLRYILNDIIDLILSSGILLSVIGLVMIILGNMLKINKKTVIKKKIIE